MKRTNFDWLTVSGTQQVPVNESAFVLCQFFFSSRYRLILLMDKLLPVWSRSALKTKRTWVRIHERGPKSCSFPGPLDTGETERSDQEWRRHHQEGQDAKLFPKRGAVMAGLQRDPEQRFTRNIRQRTPSPHTVFLFLRHPQSFTMACTELSPQYAEILTPNISECDCIWTLGL